MFPGKYQHLGLVGRLTVGINYNCHRRTVGFWCTYTLNYQSNSISFSRQRYHKLILNNVLFLCFFSVGAFLITIFTCGSFCCLIAFLLYRYPEQRTQISNWLLRREPVSIQYSRVSKSSILDHIMVSLIFLLPIFFKFCFWFCCCLYLFYLLICRRRFNPKWFFLYEITKADFAHRFL